MRRRGKRIAIASGLIALGLAAFLGTRYQDLVYWWYGYRVIRMPTEVLPGDGNRLMNSLGQVPVTFGDWNSPQGGRWSATSGELVRLGTLPGAGPGWGTIPCAVSERGAVVGIVTPDADPDSARAFLWTEEGGLMEIPGIGGKRTHPCDINSRNQVVGVADRPDGASRPFLWEPGSPPRDLGGPGNGRASAINEKGWVAGVADCRPFLWTPEAGMRDLGLPRGTAMTFSVGLSESGEVVANCGDVKFGMGVGGSPSLSQLSRPYRWAGEKLVPLPVPGGFDCVMATGAADDGTIALEAHDSLQPHQAGACFVLRNGVLRRLPGSFGFFSRGPSMDRRGRLLGFEGKAPNDGDVVVLRAAILQPVR